MASNVTRTTRRDGIQFGANGYLSLADNEIDVSSGNLTLDVAGDIKLDANGNTIDFLDGSQRAVTWEMTTGVATRLRMYEDGGDTEVDFFNIDVATNGETNIITVDQAGTVGHITIAPDGDLVLDPESQKVIINSTDKLYLDGGGDTYIKEGVADVVDIIVGGQTLLRLTENGGGASDNITTGGVLIQQQDLKLTAAKKLYFDSGNHTYIHESADDVLDFVVDDVNMLKMTEDGAASTLRAQGRFRLLAHDGSAYDDSSNASVQTKQQIDAAISAAGGGGDYYFNTTARCRTQYNNWYYGGSTTYGYNYYYWLSSTGSTSIPSAYVDSICPGYIVPKDGTVKAYTIIGNISTTDTWEFILTKGAAPTYGSAGNYSMSQIGATQSAGGTSNILYKWEQTGLSVAVSAGDIIVPYFRRTTDNDASYSYAEISLIVTLG